jgi:Putative peptidoglycan binding domain
LGRLRQRVQRVGRNLGVAGSHGGLDLLRQSPQGVEQMVAVLPGFLGCRERLVVAAEAVVQDRGRPVRERRRGQTYRHLTVDGIVGPITWATLGGDGPEPPALAEGSDGPVVAKLQTALNEGRGSFAPSSNPVLATDGIYGSQTATAVRGAQQTGGIQADGVVGLQTWALPIDADAQVLADLCGVPGPGSN